MKKIFIFLAIIVVILCVILYQYNSYQRAQMLLIVKIVNMNNILIKKYME